MFTSASHMYWAFARAFCVSNSSGARSCRSYQRTIKNEDLFSTEHNNFRLHEAVENTWPWKMKVSLWLVLGSMERGAFHFRISQRAWSMWLGNSSLSSFLLYKRECDLSSLSIVSCGRVKEIYARIGQFNADHAGLGNDELWLTNSRKVHLSRTTNRKYRRYFRNEVSTLVISLLVDAAT